MLIEFSRHDAELLAAACTGASTDANRPILEAINLEWSVGTEHGTPERVRDDEGVVVTDEDGNPVYGPAPVGLKIEAVCTDSYVLTCRTFVWSDGTGFALEDGDTDTEGNFLVPAKLLRQAILDVIKHVGNHGPADLQTVILAFDDQHVEVSNMTGSFHQRIRFVEGNFPNWRNLLPDADTEADLEFVGLNASYIAKIAKAMDAKVMTKSYNYPIRLAVQTALKPIIYRQPGVNGSDSEFFALQMPVRL